MMFLLLVGSCDCRKVARFLLVSCKLIRRGTL
jgi:hypothetical protein